MRWSAARHPAPAGAGVDGEDGVRSCNDAIRARGVRVVAMQGLTPRSEMPPTCGATVATRLALQLSLRDGSAPERRHLTRVEGWLRELLVQLEHSEEVHDVVHPLVQVRPVARAAVVAGGRGRLEPCQELL